MLLQINKWIMFKIMGLHGHYLNIV